MLSNIIMIDGVDASELKQWIETSLADNSHVLAAGYQGKTLLYERGGHKFVIKTPHGAGISRLIHTHMLRHEYKVYRKLAGYPYAPACYGMVDNRYLLLEYIEGTTIRDHRPADEAAYIEKLFDAIRQLHARDVAHMDLKKKDNLLVTIDDNPCLLDFGTAVIRKAGLHPLNRFRYRLARQFDYNAWVKHKYHDRMRAISDADRVYYRVTRIEALASRIKQTFMR
jgi:serine/threonine protein kinase